MLAPAARCCRVSVRAAQRSDSSPHDQRERGEGRIYIQQAGVSQTDDQMLRQPVRELKSMEETDACLGRVRQPNTHSQARALTHTHTHTHTHNPPHVVFRALNHSAASEQQEGSSQQVKKQQQ